MHQIYYYVKFTIQSVRSHTLAKGIAMIRLPAEWEHQDGVLVTWPHSETDWHPYLDLVEPVFVEIIRQISKHERVVVVVENIDDVRRKLADAGIDLSKTTFAAVPSNDTWSRDFGPITIEVDGTPTLLDFGFNGWGLKFAADQDNQITRRLHNAGVFGNIPRVTPPLILEGGSIESDGKGTILTTSECLLNPNRNPHLTRSEVEQALKLHLGATRILWLDNGYLAGDDTDSHIDTLARLGPDDTILYVGCDDQQDEHYVELSKMRAQLAELRTADGSPYRLIPLPFPQACYDEDGLRLPATYANYLVINKAVLVPTYEDSADSIALEAVRKAYPSREIIAVDCSPLILQHGSLHCVTMQLPKGVLP